MTKQLVLALGLFTVGCGGNNSGGGVGGGGPDPGAQSYTVTFGPIAVPPGTENTQCMVKRLGNTAPLHVGKVHNVLGNASHHMVVYRVADTVEQTAPFACRPFQDTLTGKGAPIMISQTSDDTLEMPAGVAYTLDANQMIRIEMHYINATKGELMLTSSTTMTEVKSFNDEASFFLIGGTDINIPSNSDATLGPVFLPLDPAYADAKFFALTGHEHQLGTNVQVALANSPTDTGTMIYDVANWIWSEPATVRHNPPFTIQPGGGFRFTCTWHNPNPDVTAPPVHFGESANDEMCFFWAYYYPSHGSHVCLHSEMGGMISNHCIN